MSLSILFEKVSQSFLISSPDSPSLFLQLLLVLAPFFPAMFVVFLFLLAGLTKARETKEKNILKRENLLQLVEVD